MPIVFVHGVAARDTDEVHQTRWETYQTYLRQYIAPLIAPDPENVAISMAYWGDIGVNFAWGGASCPTYQSASFSEHPLALLFSMGSHSDIAWEMGKRGLSLPGAMTAKMVTMMRDWINREAVMFMGDAFQYFALRGQANHPGAIPIRVLEVLETAAKNQLMRQNEPLIVLSHSLGGQIIYDIVTHFLPHMPQYAGIHIDFWGAASSQVGLFEELKLFLVSSPQYGPGNPVPFPDKTYLGHWWNIWDPHDFLSFTVKDIIIGVDDGFYDSGLGLSEAHHACIEQPSFYSMFAEKLQKVFPLPPS